jgi:hypothetical protein
MMPDNDRWHGLTSGYGDAYDPRPALEMARAGLTWGGWDGWDLLWENLHDQGRIGTASYAAVPEIVGLIQSEPYPNEKAYALLARIESCRLAGKGPPLPGSLQDGYCTAWRTILSTASLQLASCGDERLALHLRAVIAHAKRLATE